MLRKIIFRSAIAFIVILTGLLIYLVVARKTIDLNYFKELIFAPEIYFDKTLKINLNDASDLNDDYDRGIISGEVVILPEVGLTREGFYSYVKSRDLKIKDFFYFGPPSIGLKWKKEVDQDGITCQEMGKFFNEIASDPEIIDLGGKSPIIVNDRYYFFPEDKCGRWNWFSVKLLDISKKDEFLSRHPGATFLFEGRMEGLFNKKREPGFISFVYKGERVLRVVNSIQQEIGVEEIDDVPGKIISEKYHVFIMQGDNDPSFVISFPFSFSRERVASILDKYQELDLEENYLDKIFAGPSSFTIKVPKGEEEHWAEILSADPEIAHASANYKLSPF